MKPQAGKVYALTSADGPCIAKGNTWEESVVEEERICYNCGDKETDCTCDRNSDH